MTLTILKDDLSSEDVLSLINEHLSGMQSNSPPGHVNALAIESLRAPSITLLVARENDVLCGCGALKQLDSLTGEVKSMRTRSTFLRQGVGQALLDEIINTAVQRGYSQLLLETGTGHTFEPAHEFYRRNGFEFSGPFAEYAATDFNVFMAKTLRSSGAA